MTEKPVEVGKRIRELREEKGLSLQGLAEITGYSSALLSQFENHLVSPPLGALIKLSRALETDVGHFLGDTQDQTMRGRLFRGSLRGQVSTWDTPMSPSASV
jgi:transcriptional regulator with XRE-family HTH domain